MTTSRRLLLVGSSQALGMVLRYAVLVVLARMLSQADFGEYTALWAVLAWTSVLCMGGWPSVFLAEIPKFGLSREGLRRSQKQMFVRCAIIAAGQTLVLAVLSARGFSVGAILMLAIALGAMSFGSAMSEAARGLGMIIESRLALAAVPTIVTLVLCGGWALIGGSANAAFAITVMSAGWLSLFVLMAWRVAGRTDHRARPLAGHGRAEFTWIKVSQALLGTADVFIVSVTCSVEDAALYGVATRVAVLAGFALNSITMLYGPRLSHAAQDGRELRAVTRRATTLSAMLTIPLIVGIAVLNGPILSAFGHSYREAAPLLLIMLLGTGANALFGPIGTVVNVNGQHGMHRNVMVVSAILFVPLVWATSYQWGPVGAAWTTATLTLCWNLILWRRVDFHAYSHGQGRRACPSN